VEPDDAGTAPTGQGIVSGPWAQDINETFTDPVVATAVSAFMQAKYQPYVTKVEMERAAFAEKAELYDQFEEDTSGTFLAIAEEIYGEEGRDAIISALTAQDNAPEGTVAPELSSLMETDEMKYIKQMVERDQAAQAQAQYDALVDATVAANPGVEKDLLHPFVYAANGDMDAAIEKYNTWVDSAKTRFSTPAPTGEPAPPTITKQGGNTPPVAKKYGSNLKAAIDDMFAEMGSAPPTV